MTLRKKRRTRRHRALRRLLLCALFILVPLGLHMVSFTPTQLLRGAEHRLGLEQTEILAQTKAGSKIYTLSANETLLLVTKFSPPVQVFSPDGPDPYRAISLSFTKREFWSDFFLLPEDGATASNHIQFFGLVDLPAAASVRIFCDDMDPSCTFQAQLFSGPGGYRYFWADFYAPATHPDLSPYWIVILDQAGQILQEDYYFDPRL